jgi:hypothetical protein
MLNKYAIMLTFTTALRRMGFEKKEIVAHGIRQTASTMLNEAGWPFLIVKTQAYQL